MKRLLFFILILFLLLNFLPLLIISLFSNNKMTNNYSPEKSVRVLFSETNKVETLDIDTYLIGVVAAEMPAGFPEEALKAQAIAARTYTLYKMAHQPDLKDNNHPNADICTNPLYCQAWISVQEQNKRWGRINAPYYRQKITEAVLATRGQVLTYKGQLIDPLYHSTCGGETESAADVWNFDEPYLQNVPCPYDRYSPKYLTKVKVSIKEVNARLGTKLKNSTWYRRVPFSKKIKILAHTTGGRVKTILIDKKKFSGIDIRNKFNLNSAKFSISVEKNYLIFTVKGYGHGVGLCQYGAGGMANQGKNVAEILKYYYHGVDISKAY